MKIVIIAGYTKSIISFRGDLIRAMVQAGHEVITAGPEVGHEEEIAALGATYVQIPLKRAGMNPLKDLALLLHLRKLLKREQPDVVLSYTIKPVIYGSIATKLAGIRNVFSMVTGLGYVFTAKGLKAAIIRTLSKSLYYVALKCCNHVFFQNPDDRNEFVQSKLIKERKCVLINGSGVNLEYYQPAPLAGEPVFLMICRLLRDKGVLEYMQAAQQVKQLYPKARFQLLGPYDPNPSAVSYEDLKPYLDRDIIEYLGEKQDVRPFIRDCSIYVLPSYREGTPRSVLEAMAMGRPIITTDAPGCKETVSHMVNGLLVTVKDVQSLADAMIWMIEHEDQVEIMSQRSLEMCQVKYDVNKINKVIMDTLGL